MIDQVTIAKIMDAAQIKDVVSEFVSLKQRGANYIGLCPFHNEKTGSFTVSPAKGIFKCFGCGEGGNAVHFIICRSTEIFGKKIPYRDRRTRAFESRATTAKRP